MTDDRYARGGEVVGPRSESVPVLMTPGAHVITRDDKIFVVVDQS